MSLKWSLLATIPPIALSIILALFAPLATVMALNAVLVCLHTTVYAYSLPGNWPFKPATPILPQEKEITSEETLRARQIEDWVGQFEDTRMQVVDEWSLSFATTATARTAGAKRQSGSTQSSPVRLAARLYSPVKARLRSSRNYDDTFGTTSGVTAASAVTTFNTAATSGTAGTAGHTEGSYVTAPSMAKTSKGSKTSDQSVRFARPMSPTPKAARGGFDESDMSVAPLRLPPLAKVAPAPAAEKDSQSTFSNTRKPSTPPRLPHAPVHSTLDGSPTSWLSSPGASSVLHPDWSFSSMGSDPAAFIASLPGAADGGKRSSLISTSGYRTSLNGHRTSLLGNRTSLTGNRTSLTGNRTSLTGNRTSLSNNRTSLSTHRPSLSVDLPREPPYAFLAQDPAPKRKRGSTQTAASVSFHDYVSVHSAHSTSRQKLSDAPGTVRRLSCPASLADASVAESSGSIGGSILGDYSASPTQPLPRSFESLRSFRTRTQSKSSREPEEGETEKWEFVPNEIFRERLSDDNPPVYEFSERIEEKEEGWTLGWPGVVGSLLLLGLSSPVLLAPTAGTRALLLASSFVPSLVIATAAFISPREVERDIDIEAEQERIKYNPRDRSLRPSYGKLLRPRPELSFAPPSPLKSRPRTMSAAARLRTLRGGIVSAIAMGHCASDSVGSTGTNGTQATQDTMVCSAEADGSHGWLDAHIGVATVATRSRSPSVLKLDRVDWTGLGSVPATPRAAPPAAPTVTAAPSVHAAPNAAVAATTPRKPLSPTKILASLVSPRSPRSPRTASPKKAKESDEESGAEQEAEVGEATAVAPSPSRVQRRRTSHFATSGCDFSLPSTGYAPSLRGSVAADASTSVRYLPKRAPLNRVVTCPISKATAPAPRLPKSSVASGSSGSSAGSGGTSMSEPATASSSDTFGTRLTRTTPSTTSASHSARASASASASGTAGTVLAPVSESEPSIDFSQPRQISLSSSSSEGGEGIGRAILGFNIPPPRTPLPPPPSIPATAIARTVSEKIDLYSTPARAAKSSETASIGRNAELAWRLLSEAETPAPTRHKRSFSGGSVRSHPYSVSRSRSSRSTNSTRSTRSVHESKKAGGSGWSKGHKTSSWASIKASLKSSVPSPRTPCSGVPRLSNDTETPRTSAESGLSGWPLRQGGGGSQRPSTPSTIARLESSLEEPIRVPRSHPHPRPFGYTTPWDAPFRARGAATRPVPDVGSSYEVSSREHSRHTRQTRQPTDSESAFARQLAAKSTDEKGRKGLRPLVLAERHNEPVKRSPRFGTPNTSYNVSGGSWLDMDGSGSRDKTGIRGWRSFGTPEKSVSEGGGAGAGGEGGAKGGEKEKRSSIFGLGWSAAWGSGAGMVTSPNVRAGRGRDTSPVRREQNKSAPRPIRM